MLFSRTTNHGQARYLILFLRKRKRERSNVYYHLFLDDNREPKDVKWIELPLVEWIIVRNYKDFVETIVKNGIPVTVSFDHDLGDEHYQEYARVRNAGFRIPIDYARFEAKTGYDCAKWLANYCVDTNTPLPLYYVHTQNGPGRANICSVMESARGYLMKFTIPGATPEEKEAWRQRMRERGLIQ